MVIILAVSIGLYTFLFSIAILSMLARDRRHFELRIKDLIQEDISSERPIKINKIQHQRLPASRALANDLISAGIRMRPEEYLVIWGLVSLLPTLVMVLFNAHWITDIAVALIGLAVPPYYVNRQKAKRLVKFESQLSEALVMVGNCLRSGLTFQQGMNNIATEMPDPIGREFSRAVREINLGSNVDVALSNMVDRIDSTDLSLAVSAIQIQRQVGGNLLEILDNISETIKDRIKIKNDIKVMTASGRSSGFIIGFLPIAISGILMLINPGYMKVFFTTKIGLMMLIAGASLETIGFLLIKKIVSIKY